MKWDIKKKLEWKDAGYASAPAFLYLVLMNLVGGVLPLIFGGRGISDMHIQMAAFLACIIVFGDLAVKEHILQKPPKVTVYRYPAAFCYVVAAVMCGVACNHMISFLGLMNRSAGYRHITEVFYGNGLLIEIVTLGILGPVVEELVYRGFVYQRFRRKCSRPAAVILTALLFGVFHLNFVQGLYAFVVGCYLGLIVAKTDSVIIAMAAHMAVNLIAVLWTETDWLDFLNQTGTGAYLLTGVCILLFVIFTTYANNLIKK